MGAISLPFREIRANPDRIRDHAYGDKEVVFTCKIGLRARDAAAIAENVLERQVLVVDGGTDAWVQQGLDHESDPSAISIERQVQITAGAIIVISIVLGFLVHPGLFVLAGFVGAGFTYSGLTNTCGMSSVLSLMPWNR
jgi:3-mercaptopyruvate sulfurtransferase SseA